MRRLLFIPLYLIATCSWAFAGKWFTGTTAPLHCAVGDAWTDTNGTADNRFYTCTAIDTWTLNGNQTAIDSKANKAATVMQWSEWANGASFTTGSPPVAYNGSLYKCIAPYTKVAGETPDTQTEYFAEVTGSGGGIAHATSDGAYYASRNGAWASLDGVFLTPTGSAAGLTNFPTLNQSTNGNAATATKLQTARTIGGVSFDGSANINLPGVNATGNQNTSGTSAGFSAQYIDWNSASGGSSIANKPTIPTVSDTAYGVGWNGDTGAASKNAIYDKIETISGGSMTYPVAGVPVSTGTAWGTSIILGTGVSAALGYAPDAVGGFLLANTYLDDPLISWDTATITETVDSPVAGTNKIGVKSGVFQAADPQLDTWAGVTPGTGVPAAIAVNTDTVGGLPVTIAKGAYTVDTASIAANTCASAVAVTAAGVTTSDTIIASPNAILSTIAGFGVTTAGAVRVDVYPTSGNVNFQFCNPTGAAIDPGSVTFNWRVLR